MTPTNILTLLLSRGIPMAVLDTIDSMQPYWVVHTASASMQHLWGDVTHVTLWCPRLSCFLRAMTKELGYQACMGMRLKLLKRIYNYSLFSVWKLELFPIEKIAAFVARPDIITLHIMYRLTKELQCIIMLLHCTSKLTYEDACRSATSILTLWGHRVTWIT